MTTAEAACAEDLVEVAGVRIQLRRGGSGAPLLILHSELGVPGWLRAYEQLARHFTVYVPSLPGFGQSARPDWIVSVRDLAAWVTWFVRDLKLSLPLPAIGFSLGGWVPAKAPEYAQYFGRAWRPEDERQAEQNREMAARLLWKPYMRSHTLAALLRGVATPTLVIWGREDAIIPLDACQRYQHAIPGATAKVLERCGHLPEMEQPDAFVKMVLDFLAPCT